MGWLSPTGFVDLYNKWGDEIHAYDDNEAIGAYTLSIGYYLELTHATILCDKVRIYAADFDNGGSTDASIAIDVYYSGGWHNIFSGIITKDTWVEKAIGSKQLVTAARIKFNAIANIFGVIWEFDFNEAIPAAPTNVQASDGVYTDRVTITWTKSLGATGYQVYRDDQPLGWLGDVATHNDYGADAPTVTPGSAVASDGAYKDKVALYLSGEGVNDGATHTYNVQAMNDAGESGFGNADTGYRGVGSLTYQWQRSAADSDADYSNIDGATTEAYDDTGAPADGSGRYYRCVENATGAGQAISSVDRGYRIPVTAPTVTTQAVSDICAITATGNGTITDTGGENCSKRGVCWNIGGNPTVADDKSEETDSFGTGAFTRPMTGLTPGQHYYVKAYAYNSAGYGYGSQVEFRTPRPHSHGYIIG